MKARQSFIDTSAVDKTVLEALKFWKTPGVAVAVIIGDQIYTKGYGVRELGKDDLVTPKTIFGLASVSKAFTTTAIAMLADEGKLSWDNHPRKYVPYFKLSDPLADANITLRDLVCHRTGMPRHDWLWHSDWSIEEIVRRYGTAKNASSFRSTYEYANIPFMAAGLVIETVSGMPWKEFVTKRIFKKLGMKSTNASEIESQKASDHASGHGKVKKKLQVVPWWKMDSIGPAGGICSTVDDMARWARFHLAGGEFDGERLLSEKALLETRKPHMVVPSESPDQHGFVSEANVTCYGLGWSVHDYRGHLINDHGGYLGGFTTRISIAPKLGVGSVVLTNTTDTPVAQAISRSLVDLTLGLDKIDWNKRFRLQMKGEEKEEKAKESAQKRIPRTRPSHNLEAYAGEFEDATYGRIKISLNDGALVMDYNIIAGARCSHYHYDTFVAKVEQPNMDAKLKLTFNQNPAGEICVLFIDELKDTAFTRLK